MQAKGRMCGCRTHRQVSVGKGQDGLQLRTISYLWVYVVYVGSRWICKEMQVQHIQESPRQAGVAHTGAGGIYFFLVFDQADETVLGRRGLRIADPHSMLKGTTGRLDCAQMQIGGHIQTTRSPCPLGIVQVHVALRVTDNHVILARVGDRRINIRHIQFSRAAQSYETARCSTK